MDLSSALPTNNGKPSAGLDAFDTAEPAPEYTPVPGGIYSAKVLSGEVTQSKAGVDAYRIRFQVTDGEHAGRLISRTWVFSEKAKHYAKRDLSQFGLTTKVQLLAPFPPVDQTVLVQLVVALQRGNDGVERNDIKRITDVRVTASPFAGFAVPPPPSEGGAQ